MNEFYKIFQPKTATFENNDTYMEIEPIEELKPYIRCFWGTRDRIEVKLGAPKIIIPDGCMDIIMDVDYDKGESTAVFCGINDKYFYVHRDEEKKSKAQFGIRFHMWGVLPLTGVSMKEVKNEYVDVEKYFRNFRADIEEAIIDADDIYERIEISQKYLLKRLRKIKEHHSDVLNSMDFILNKSGSCSIKEIKEYTVLSERTLQRMFNEHIGLSPKKVQSIVRFQNIWRELHFNKKIDLADIAYKYGYSSQGHFINDIKKYCDLTPNQIIKK